VGFDPFCREVTDSITGSRFCRIGLGWPGAAPDDVGEDHQPLRRAGGRGVERDAVGKSAEARVLKLTRVRADTTVVAANVAYPVDSSLLAKGWLASLAWLAEPERPEWPGGH
jgi:IS5 family transposase